MKRIILVLACMSLAACSKSVTRDGNRFLQSEDPNPTPTTSPGPSPSPTPTPTPTTPIGCEPNRLGELADFSVYVKEELSLSRVNVGKRVAAMDATLQRGEIGGALLANAARADLAVGQTLSVNGVKIPHGKATFGKTLDKVRSFALGGFVNEAYDLRANIRKIFEFSNVCGGAPSNTGILRTCRRGMSPEICTIRITGESSLNIAELSEAQIANVSTFVIDIPRGTTLVTNLPRNRIGIFRGVEVQLSARAASSPGETPIFWNFPVGENLEFTGTKFRGTVISPDAAVKVRGQDGRAGFWVRQLYGTDSDW